MGVDGMDSCTTMGIAMKQAADARRSCSMRGIRRAAAAWAVLAILLAGASGCCTCPEDYEPQAAWAKPIDDPNFPTVYRVTDNLYRGPSVRNDKEYAALERLGVRTIVSLRYFNHEEEEARRHGFDYIRIPVKIWDLEDEPVRDFLDVATDPSRQPVYVHCHLGSDRTGLAVGVYRVAVQGWSREEAVCELEQHWFTRFWPNVKRYIRTFDAETERGRDGDTPLPGKARSQKQDRPGCESSHDHGAGGCEDS